MAIRATVEAIRAAIKLDPNLPLDGFITAANALTEYVISKDSASLLTDELKTQIEVYLACYLAALKDQQKASEHVGRAGAQYQVGQSGLGKFELNDWGRAAMAMDVTGTLAAINEGAKPTLTVHWAGYDEDERSDWWDR